MKKSLLFTVLSVTLLASILSISTNINTSVYAEENQTGTENEAEIEAEIEQDNKCKKDSECETENEINNQLTITNITKVQEEQPETQTCETCFTNILSEEQIASFLEALSQAAGEAPFTTLEQVCEFIGERDEGESSVQLDNAILNTAFGSLTVINTNPLSEDQYNELIQCLQEVGLEVSIPPE
ncbi:MAG: hypothetical protein DA329_10835 [Candidatus Nitrosocosmicus sp.]|nr:hypothetical protein [Candidatus Nitrosocosmicus sp.]